MGEQGPCHARGWTRLRGVVAKRDGVCVERRGEGCDGAPMSWVRCEVHDGVALVTLDRPKANAIEHTVCMELAAALDVARRPEVRSAVLTGSGRFFSAGLDLFAVFEYPDDRAEAFANAFDDAIEGWFAFDKPVVAAINGHAIAGGCVLAAAADFRLVADADLKVGLTEIQVGVPFPTSALEVVRASCAGARLSEVLYRGRTYGPHQAVDLALADEVVAPQELLPRAMSLAVELGNHRHDAFASTKRALRHDPLARIRAARSAGTDPVWARWRSPDLREVMERFRESKVGRRG